MLSHHFSQNLTHDEFEIIKKAILNFKAPATQYFVIQFWFDYSKDTKNQIKEIYREEISSLIYTYRSKIFKNVRKFLADT